MEEHALVIEWEDDVNISVEYLTDRDPAEPGGWAIVGWWIESLVVDGTKFEHESFGEYLHNTMSEKHRDYIQAACEEDLAVYLDQKGS